MNVTVTNQVPINEEVFERLRSAPLENAGSEEIFIYRKAKMRLADLWPDTLNLTSLYVLRDRLAFQRQLRQHLLDKYQIDTLQLSSVLLLQNGEELFGMAPPFVEIYKERVHISPYQTDRSPPEESSLIIPFLKDGIHRAWIAREEGLPIRCVLIHGALENHQPYAYPNSWEEVVVCDDIPERKKYYRRRDIHTFMRPIRVLRSAAGAPAVTEYGRTN